MIRALVADDQAVVRAGLLMILDAQEDIQVVGQAVNGRDALDLVATLDPDVVMMDIRMPVLDGMEATRMLASSGARAKVVVLTTYGLDEYVYEALRAGAAGFLLKTDSPDRLVDAVRTVARGDALLGREATRLLIDRFVEAPPPNVGAPAEVGALTERELEVLKLVSEGLSNAEIARALYVSEGTVKTHVARVLSKLGLRDRVQVVVFAFQTGLVRPGGAPRSR